MLKLTSVFLLGAALMTPLGAQPPRDRDYDRRDRNGYYDNDRRDYHQWNSHEERAWRRYWQEQRHSAIEWQRAKEEQRRAYWRWRHDHPDTMLWRDRR